MGDVSGFVRRSEMLCLFKVSHASRKISKWKSEMKINNYLSSDKGNDQLGFEFLGNQMIVIRQCRLNFLERDQHTWRRWNKQVNTVVIEC